MRFSHLLASAALPVTIVLNPSTADAQELAIEEIVVTAQKREQSLQDVPIAVSAFDEAALERAGITDIQDLVGLAPSLFLSSSASEAAGAVARIRGVGTTGDNPGLESSVAVFVDGVYRNRTNVALTDMGPVQRIEVLRGPQGTLFGKNASAGLIHILTSAPEYEANGYAELSVGNFGYVHVGAGYTGPIVDDSVAFRVDFTQQKRDGFIDDLFTGQDYNDRDRYLVRAQLLAEPNDDLSIRVIADYADRDETCCAATTLTAGPTRFAIAALGGTVIADQRPFDRLTTVNEEKGYQQEVEDKGISAEVNWNNAIGTFTSITAVRDWQADRSQDIDYTNADILFRPIDGSLQNFETFSQEFRLAGSTDTLDWMVGFFYADEDLTLDDAIQTGRDYEGYIDFLLGAPGTLAFLTGIPPGQVYQEGFGVNRDLFEQNAESFALFTHNTWRVSDRLELGFGLRYTEEEKTVDASLASTNPACFAALGRGIAPPAALGVICLPFFNPLLDGTYSADREDTEWTGTVSLAYTFNEDWLGYASIGRGFKAGGFNLDRAGLDNPLLGLTVEGSDLDFAAELVDSFEIGAKGTLADGRVQLNAAAYYSDFEDFQLNTFNGISFVVDNLEDATTKGIELEALALVAEGFTIQSGVTWGRAAYGDNLIDPLTGQPRVQSGRTLTNAPDLSVTSSLTYESLFGDNLRWFGHIDGRYTSDINTGSDLDIEKVQGGFTLFNAKVGIGSANETWSVELWARNLTDKNYRQIAFDAPLQGSGTGPGTTQTFNAFLGEPRTYGATVRLNF